MICLYKSPQEANMRGRIGGVTWVFWGMIVVFLFSPLMLAIFLAGFQLVFEHHLLHILMSCLALSVFGYVMLSYVILNSQYQLAFKLWLRMMLVIPAILGTMMIFASSQILMAVNLVPPEEMANLNQGMISFSLVSTLIAAPILILFELTVFRQFSVRKNEIVIANEQILYPGDKFKLWPWLNYKLQILENTCNCGTFDVTDERTRRRGRTSNIKLTFDWEQSRQAGVTNLNPGEFLNAYLAWVQNLLQQAFNRSPDEELEMNTVIHGVPVSWDGQVTYMVS